MSNINDQRLHKFKSQGRLHSGKDAKEQEVPQHGHLHFIQALVSRRADALRELDEHRKLQFKLLSYPDFRILQTEIDPQSGPLYAVASSEVSVQSKILSWLEGREKYMKERLTDLEYQIENAEEHWKKWKRAKDPTILREELKILKREYHKVSKAVKETADSLHYLEALENEWRKELLSLSGV
jgi:hypothetical protein